MYSNNIYLSIKCIYTGLVKNVYKVTIFNRVVGVMVSVLASSAAEFGFEHASKIN